MKTLLAFWDGFWFSTNDRYQYGIFRIVLVGGLFVVAWNASRFNWVWAAINTPGEFTSPTLLASVLHLPFPIPVSWAGPILWASRVLIFTSLVGLATRPSLIALSLLNLALNSIINSYGQIDHSTTLPSLVLLILAFAPGVTEPSLDALIRRWRNRESADSKPVFGRRLPVWPAQLVLVLFALGYFTSGYSKVAMGTWAWLDGRTLTAYLTDPWPSNYFLADRDADDSLKWRDGVGLESFIYSAGQPTPLAHLAASSALVMLALSTVTVLWEITFPVTLVFRRLLPLYLLVGLGFHLSIILTLQLKSFYTYPLCYLIFVDWRKVGAAVQYLRRKVARQVEHSAA